MVRKPKSKQIFHKHKKVKFSASKLEHNILWLNFPYKIKVYIPTVQMKYMQFPECYMCQCYQKDWMYLYIELQSEQVVRSQCFLHQVSNNSFNYLAWLTGNINIKHKAKAIRVQFHTNLQQNICRKKKKIGRASCRERV